MTPRHLLEPGRLAGSALLKAQGDNRLVDLTRAGNDRAFEAIVDRYSKPLLRYCSRILPDGRGEDAVQQTFLNAYNALHRETTPLSLKSWLFGIAHNVSLNVLRQRGSSHDELEAHHQATNESAAQAVERSERFREVLTAVAALPPGQRDALLLRELEGRGHDEIARELGVTGGAARQLISRARSGVRAAAASFFPLPLVMRLTDGSAAPPTAARMAELTAAGGGLTIGKLVATAAVGGTLIGGAVKAPDIVRPERGGGDVAQAADTDTTGDGDQTAEVSLNAAAGTGRDNRAVRADAQRRQRAGEDADGDKRGDDADGNEGEEGGRGGKAEPDDDPAEEDDSGRGGHDDDSGGDREPNRGEEPGDERSGSSPEDEASEEARTGSGGSGEDVLDPVDLPEPEDPPEIQNALEAEDD